MSARDSASRIERLRAEREARRAQIAREDSGEARGFRYAIVCCVGWVGPYHLPGPRVFDDSCTHAKPTVYEGDRDSAQARAQMHAERNERGGATHHSPEIVPDEYIARVTAQRRWR